MVHHAKCIWSILKIFKGRTLEGHGGHVPLMAQSPSVTEPAHTPVVRQRQMAALLNWQQMRLHEKFQLPLRLRNAYGDFPVGIWAFLI